MHSDLGNGHRHVPKSLLSVRRICPVETRVDRRSGRNRKLSLFFYSKSTERGHSKNVPENEAAPESVRYFHRRGRAGNPSLVGNSGMVHRVSGSSHRASGCHRGGHCLSGRYARCHFADVSSDGAFHRASFCDAAHRKNPVSPVDARVSSAHLERSSRRHSGSCAGNAGTGCHMDVRHEPEQRKQRHCDLVHRSGKL